MTAVFSVLSSSSSSSFFFHFLDFPPVQLSFFTFIFILSNFNYSSKLFFFLLQLLPLIFLYSFFAPVSSLSLLPFAFIISLHPPSFISSPSSSSSYVFPHLLFSSFLYPPTFLLPPPPPLALSIQLPLPQSLSPSRHHLQHCNQYQSTH